MTFDSGFLVFRGSYRGPATYSQERIQQAKAVRQKVVRFLVDAEEWLRNAGESGTKQWTTQDRALFNFLSDCTTRGIRSLLTDLDGSGHVAAITEIADEGNRYLKGVKNGTL